MKFREIASALVFQVPGPSPAQNLPPLGRSFCRWRSYWGGGVSVVGESTFFVRIIGVLFGWSKNRWVSIPGLPGGLESASRGTHPFPTYKDTVLMRTPTSLRDVPPCARRAGRARLGAPPFRQAVRWRTRRWAELPAAG